MTNTKNNKSVVLRVDARGPTNQGRIVDSQEIVALARFAQQIWWTPSSISSMRKPGSQGFNARPRRRLDALDARDGSSPEGRW